MPDFNEHDALAVAVEVAQQSPCEKSKRGVVIFNKWGVAARGSNHPPAPFVCTGDEACRAACNKICIHAEQDAIVQYQGAGPGMNLLHVETIDGKPVPSGPPSCWQCSRLIVGAAFDAVWLLHEDGLRRYDPVTFHRDTLRYCQLPLVERAKDW